MHSWRPLLCLMQRTSDTARASAKTCSGGGKNNALWPSVVNASQLRHACLLNALHSWKLYISDRQATCCKETEQSIFMPAPGSRSRVTVRAARIWASRSTSAGLWRQRLCTSASKSTKAKRSTIHASATHRYSSSSQTRIPRPSSMLLDQYESSNSLVKKATTLLRTSRLPDLWMWDIYRSKQATCRFSRFCVLFQS